MIMTVKTIWQAFVVFPISSYRKKAKINMQN